MGLLSIITVNLNDKMGLSKTLESLRIQAFRDFEHIIIDGASTDGSFALIKENEHCIHTWVSEKDTGIYNAMNKGIKKATGKYLLFLNSGDYLLNSDSLSLDFSNLDEDILYGNHTTDENGKLTTSSYDFEIDLGFLVASTLPHCSTFIKKELFDGLGLYDETYRICSDWVFFYNAIICNNATTHYLNCPVSVFILDGISSNPKSKEIIAGERRRQLSSHMDVNAENYIKTTYLKIKKSQFASRDLEKVKKEFNQYYEEQTKIKGLALLLRLNKLYKF